MLLTGAAAVGVVMAVGEKGAEQAVLHVEEGHVLVHRHLQATRRRAPQQRQQLG